MIELMPSYDMSLFERSKMLTVHGNHEVVACRVDAFQPQDWVLCECPSLGTKTSRTFQPLLGLYYHSLVYKNIHQRCCHASPKPQVESSGYSSDKSWDSIDRNKAEMAEEASNKNTEKERSVINLDIFSFVWCEWEVPNLNFIIDSIPQSSNGAVFSDFLPCTEELCSILRVAIWSACFRYQESGRSRDHRTATI